MWRFFGQKERIFFALLGHAVQIQNVTKGESSRDGVKIWGRLKVNDSMRLLVLAGIAIFCVLKNVEMLKYIVIILARLSKKCNFWLIAP